MNVTIMVFALWSHVMQCVFLHMIELLASDLGGYGLLNMKICSGKLSHIGEEHCSWNFSGSREGGFNWSNCVGETLVLLELCALQKRRTCRRTVSWVGLAAFFHRY